MNRTDAYVISMAHLSFAEGLALTNKYPFIELRLDLLDWSADQINQFLDHAKKTIVSTRVKDQMLERLDSIDFSKADCIDIELDAPLEHRNHIQSLIPREIPVIWSVHFYDRFELPNYFRSIFDQVSEEKDLFKFVSLCSSAAETQALMNSYTENKIEILIGLGEMGKETRRRALDLGAAMMYCQASEIGPVASGQLSYEEINDYDEIEAKSERNYFLSGVIGNPIGHSLSPNLFNPFFQHNHIPGKYLRIALQQASELELLPSFLPLKFVNITAPFKRSFDTPSPINYCQFVPEKKTLNTDAIAIEEMLKNLADGSKILVIGAGGAAEAALMASKNLAQHFVIAGRNEHKTSALAAKYGAKTISFELIPKQIDRYEAIIWTIPSFVIKDFGIQFREDQIVIDANYHQPITNYHSTEIKNYFSGQDWLVHQAVPIMKRFEKEVHLESLYANIHAERKEQSSIISLIGMPGSGKSSVARALAALSGWQLIDLDLEIEKKEGVPIREIFATKGEAYFRVLESEVLQDCLSKDQCILGTGGGSVIDSKNRALLCQNTRVVWLATSLTDIKERTASNQERPLLNSTSDNVLNRLWKQRLPLYADIADLMIPTFSSPDEIAKRIHREYFLS